VGRVIKLLKVAGISTVRPIKGSTISRNFAGCAVATKVHLAEARFSGDSREYTSAAVAVCGHQI
jgi:hypothetical protein